jgi:Relaxase/Mobilisation nuclease domain
MAIGKITKGNGFYGLMRYLLDEEKSPQIIGGCLIGSKPDDIAREFRQIANLRQSVEKPVRHISISFAPEDGKVDDVVKEAIAYRILDGLGYCNCQFMAIGHRRDQKGHDEVHDHDHMHIVTNAVTLDGKHVRDSFDGYKVQEILRLVEKEFGLEPVKSSWEVNKERGKNQEVDRESEIAVLVADSLKDKPSLATWLGRLAVNQIDVRFSLTDRDVVKGVTFIKDGEAYKGSSIGAKWSSHKKDKYPTSLDGGSLIVNEIVEIVPEDISLMKAANLRSQQHTVRLNELNRAMFDRAVEMAEMTLLNKGKNEKFRNGRAEISLDGDNLKVRRVRPQKLMFEAARVDGKWEPVGFPNIEKVDIQLLERINAVDGMNFKASERKASATKQKDSRERVDVGELADFTGVDDELEGERVETTPKVKVQAAIDWAAEQANDTVVEFVGYLAQRGVETKLELDANDEVVNISYKLDEVSFKSGELTDASLSQLQAVRGLTFNLPKATLREGTREVGIETFQADEDRHFQDYIESGRRNLEEMRVKVQQDSLRIEAELRRNYDKILGVFQPNNRSAEVKVELPIEAPAVTMTISFSDLNNYRNYLNSREYKESLPPGEREDLDRSSNRTIDPLVNAWRSIGRAAVGDEKLPASHQFFRSFETELDLSEKDAAGIEMAREWASMQPEIEKKKGSDRSRGR